MLRMKTAFAALAATAAMMAPSFVEAQTTIRIQTVIPIGADEVVMLREFGEDVTRLTDGEVRFEILPAGAVVGVAETLDAVYQGLIEGGFAWTHYWSGKHPAAVLFGSPPAGSGLGMDNAAWVSWYLYGGGQELYDRLWEEMGVNVKGFVLQPVGPEALGWFKEPLASMDEFRERRFRVPPGITGQVYSEMGVPAVAMGGGDIVPALERGVLDGAEWCCPKPDMVYGFQRHMKHYYLQGLHQIVVNADVYLNRDVWEGLSEAHRTAIEVAANASLTKTVAYRILENGRALKELIEDHGVQLHDTPDEYFTEFMAATQKVLEQNAEDNAFFREVLESQRAFADVAVPYWAESQRLNAIVGEEYARNVPWWQHAKD